MPLIDVDVDSSGPVFDGMAYELSREFTHHVEDTLGEMGVSMIRAYLPTQYMYLGHHGGTPRYNPIPPNAGFLQASIHTERMTEDSLLITDTPVTYGPWIEGTSDLNWVMYHQHRNPPPRRFPGYHAFRKIGQSLEAMAGPIAFRELLPYLRAMNGE
jgi:hypothetical protein